MTPFILRDISIGSGKPKICIPLMAQSLTDLRQKAAELSALPFDLVEWRADAYALPLSACVCLEATGQLRKHIGNRPLLATVRRSVEGGMWDKGNEAYHAAILSLCTCPEVDIIDIEWCVPQVWRDSLMKAAKKNGKAVILSHHNFDQTPTDDAMRHCLSDMIALGADLPKLAVMPQTPQDVLRLLTVTAQVSAQSPVPIITISMGKLGWISRVSGACFGSAITFATAAEASAPGQLPATLLRNILENT